MFTSLESHLENIGNSYEEAPRIIMQNAIDGAISSHGFLPTNIKEILKSCHFNDMLYKCCHLYSYYSSYEENISSILYVLNKYMEELARNRFQNYTVCRSHTTETLRALQKDLQLFLIPYYRVLELEPMDCIYPLVDSVKTNIKVKGYTGTTFITKALSEVIRSRDRMLSRLELVGKKMSV